MEEAGKNERRVREKRRTNRSKIHNQLNFAIVDLNDSPENVYFSNRMNANSSTASK